MEGITLVKSTTTNVEALAQGGLLARTISKVREVWWDKKHRAPAFFTGSSLALSVSQLLSGVVMVHYITPHDMGLWASMSMALIYGFFALAGVQNGLSRELPYYLGANKEGRAEQLAATTLFYTTVGCGIALTSGIGTTAYLVWKQADSKVIWAVVSVTLLVAFKFYQNYLFITFRSKNSFVDLARVQMWQAALMILALPFIIWFGFGGMLFRYVTVAGLGLYLMHRVRPLKVSPIWKNESFVLLLKTGIPIFATDYISTCAGTLDKVALLRFGGVEQVGLYALAVSASSAFQVIPQSLAHYAYPRMSHRYGRTNDPHTIWGMAWKTSLVVAASMIPIAVVGSWFLPLGVKLLFPKYVAGIHAAEITLFAAVAFGASVGANALSSLKAWSHLFTYQLSYAVLLMISPFIGIRLVHSPLDGVAYGVLGANILGTILALSITYAATHKRAIDVSVCDMVLCADVETESLEGVK